MVAACGASVVVRQEHGGYRAVPFSDDPENEIASSLVDGHQASPMKQGFFVCLAVFLADIAPFSELVEVQTAVDLCAVEGFSRSPGDDHLIDDEFEFFRIEHDCSIVLVSPEWDWPTRERA